MRVSWDDVKNEENFAKHDVWFEEACTTFSDVAALEIFDVDHSQEEDRFILLGMSSRPRLLVVVYCDRDGNQVRVISARKATRREAMDYAKGIRFQ